MTGDGIASDKRTIAGHPYGVLSEEELPDRLTALPVCRRARSVCSRRVQNTAQTVTARASDHQQCGSST